MTFTITSLDTPYGFAMFASRPIACGTLAVLLDEPNPHAALYAAKKNGVTHVVEAITVQPLDRLLQPDDVVIPDHLLDRTQGRRSTYFVNRGYGFIGQQPVWCPVLRKALIAGAQEINPRTFTRGTLAVIDQHTDVEQAPHWNAHVAATAGAPTAFLAKELELCYAVVALLGAAASDMGNNIVAAFQHYLPAERDCACGTTMQATRTRGLIGDDWQTWIEDSYGN